jgi:Host cell surface-exposed lipoprotein
MTPSQQQAVDSAQSYLSDGEGFSEYSLLNQLTSSSGDGFSQADAQFAINYLHPDWYVQALESAKGYMSDGEGFSRSSLLEQLTSTSGDGFTQAQAQYAVNAVFSS